jgi:glucose/arabinose dehydrogenase
VTIVLVAGLTACRDDPDAGSPAGTDASSGPGPDAGGSVAPEPLPPAAPTTIGPPGADQLAGAALALQPFADIPRATALVTRPADGAIYVTAQTGEVFRIAPGGTPELALDLRPVVTPYEQGSERGLLGIAFSPADGRMFVYYTDHGMASHLASYAMLENGYADPGSHWPVIDIPQTGMGHKGGGLSFDRGILYLALGDGGGTNGRDAQDYTSLLGSIIRIVPRPSGPGYDFPTDNPFVGDPTKRPELWAKGLRNPWGFYRDPVTGHLWTADVGNDSMEEIDRLPAGVGGLNLGWYFIEGTQVNHEGAPPDAMPPLFAYLHADVGPAAIGGRVYRGAAIPALSGAYVFGDLAGATFAIGAGDQTTRLDLAISGVVTGFGEGPDGELYALTHSEGVKKIVPG